MTTRSRQPQRGNESVVPMLLMWRARVRRLLCVGVTRDKRSRFSNRWPQKSLLVQAPTRLSICSSALLSQRSEPMSRWCGSLNFLLHGVSSRWLRGSKQRARCRRAIECPRSRLSPRSSRVLRTSRIGMAPSPGPRPCLSRHGPKRVAMELAQRVIARKRCLTALMLRLFRVNCCWRISQTLAAISRRRKRCTPR